MRCHRARVRLAVVLVAGTIAPQAAAHPDTPFPEFGDVPCVTIVDQATDPVLAIGYEVPEPPEPWIPPADALPDADTFQLFAFLVQPDRRLPNWITQSDLDRAAATGIVDPQSVPTDEILEVSSLWRPEDWFRIVADDERIALDPVVDASVAWDVSGRDARAYVIQSYSFEPPGNVWLARPGIVRVMEDAADPASAGPAALVDVQPGESIVAGESYEVRVCVHAMPGSELTTYWSDWGPNPMLDWKPIASEAVEAGEIRHVVPTTVDQANRTIRLKAEIEDPTGRSFTSYAQNAVIVHPPPPDTDTSMGGAGSGEDSTTPDASSTGPASHSSGYASAGATAGCACSGRVPAATPWILLVFARRRRTARAAR